MRLFYKNTMNKSIWDLLLKPFQYFLHCKYIIFNWIKKNGFYLIDLD